MISVIVPVYKVEKYLRKCVESIQNQTYRDLQIILVNDGSPDNCGDICDEYAMNDSRIQVIHQKNGGLSSARNTGMKHATGEYIIFIDSDDYIDCQMFEVLKNTLEEKDSDISMCGCYIVSEDGNEINSDLFDDEVLSGDKLIEKCILPLKTAVWNKLFRKSTIENYSFPENRIHGEDLVFLSKVLMPETSIATTSYGGYYYVKHSDSITMRPFSEKSIDEVYCKDISAKNFSEKFPNFQENFEIWRYRARMNNIRKISLLQSNEYNFKMTEYMIWINKNYHLVAKSLPVNMKIEIFFMKYLRYIYILLLRFKRLF